MSGRQREILVLYSDGYCDKEIARLLMISPATVKTHFARVLARLGVRHRGQAVARAYRMGIL